MRNESKRNGDAVRVLSAGEIEVVSGAGGGGVLHPIRHDGLGGLRRALGGGLLGEIATEVVHTGRRVARSLPIGIV